MVDKDEAARRYETLLPNEIHILILGVGLDGHIASLFPGHPALDEQERKVLPVSQIGVKHDRITITPQVISSAKEVFLLATGREKGKVLAKALSSQIGYKEFPVCLTFGGTWLLDEDAAMEISLALKQ
jgi:6-phosphogluconolactonase